MGCTSCKTGGKGCNNNGACGVNGCAKLNVFDWLANMELPEGTKVFDKVEIRFKNNRKDFFLNNKDLPLAQGDVVVVEGSPGYDVGVVSVVGELARIQIRKKNINTSEIKRIYRKANDSDISTWIKAREKEDDARLAATKAAKELKLTMKFSDVEYQGDNSKGIFYYTAPNRVDFRALIVKLSEALGVRVEMRQINARQEAALLGGIGNCGRELCCSTWLSDFRHVTQKAARYQSLSINSEKINGQCGKLKCCLNYELDTYIEAANEFPRESVKLDTKNGLAHHAKTDIFKRQVWYVYEGKESSPIVLELERVQEIIEMNKKGEKPQDLREFMAPSIVLPEDIPTYENAEGEGDLTRFDKGKNAANRKKKRPAGNAPKRGQKPAAKAGERPKEGVAKRKPNQPKKPVAAKPNDGEKPARPPKQRFKPRPKNNNTKDSKPS